MEIFQNWKYIHLSVSHTDKSQRKFLHIHMRNWNRSLCNNIASWVAKTKCSTRMVAFLNAPYMPLLTTWRGLCTNESFIGPESTDSHEKWIQTNFFGFMTLLNSRNSCVFRNCSTSSQLLDLDTKHPEQDFSACLFCWDTHAEHMRFTLWDLF